MKHRRGDHLKVRRLGGIYTHHGIYVGGGQVIHYTGEPLRRREAEIKRASLEEFAKGGTVVQVPRPPNAFRSSTIVVRAESKLGEQKYRLLYNNCEHFATWCQTGQRRSEQADRVLSVARLPQLLVEAMIGLPGTFGERYAGVVAWRVSLLKGTLPPRGTWPGVAVDGPLRLAAQRLNVVGYFDGQPELVDEFLGDALQAFGRGEQALQQHLRKTLARHVEAHLRRTLPAQLNALVVDLLGPEMHATIERALPVVGAVLDRMHHGASLPTALAEVAGEAIGRKLADLVRPKIAEFVDTTVDAFVELQREVGELLPDGFVGEVIGSVLNTVSRLALTAMEKALAAAVLKYAATTPTSLIGTVVAAVFAPVLNEVVRGLFDLLHRLKDTIPLGPLDALLDALPKKEDGLCSSPDTPGKVANALADAIDGSGKSKSGQWLRDAADAFERQFGDSQAEGGASFEQALGDALSQPSDPLCGYNFDMDAGYVGGEAPQQPPQPPEFGAEALRMAREYATAEFASGDLTADAEVVEQWEQRVETWRELEEMFGELGALLGDRSLGRNILRHTGFKEMRKLSELLKKRDDLVELVRSLGKLREEEGDGVSLAEEIMQPMRRAGERQVRTPLVASDVRGITFGGEISRMLPSEAGLLPHPTLRMLWHARRAEHALLMYAVEGTEAQVTEEESASPEQKNNKLVRGPIIAVVDTSGSMTEGKREHFAKALILEAMRTAHAERRACLVFAFSGHDEVRELELDLSSAGISSLLEFLSWSFDGWTEIGGVTRQVLDRLGQESWSNADVMIVTDGEFDVSRSLVASVAAQRERGTRFHGVLLGTDAASLRRLCDHVHITSMRVR